MKKEDVEKELMITKDDKESLWNGAYVSGSIPAEILNVGIIETFENYSKKALRTARDVNPADLLKEGKDGLISEAFEVFGEYKKHEHQGHDLNFEKIENECGDVLWYLNLILEAVNRLGYKTSLAAAAAKNIEKLAERFPNGFNSEDSMKRVDEK